MFLLNPEILDQFGKYINYAYFFRAVPFEWDFRSQKLCLRDHEESWTLRNWKFTASLYLVHQAFITFRFLDSFHGQLESLSINILEGVYVVGYSLACAFQMTFVFKRKAIVIFVNQYMIYFKIVEKEYSEMDQKNARRLQWQFEYLTLMRLMQLAGVVASVMVFGFYIKDPSLHVFLSSIIPNIKARSLFLRLLFGIPTTLVILAGWASATVICVVSFLPCYSILFILQEMRPNRQSTVTKDKLREPMAVLSVYRCLLVLIDRSNGINRDYILMYLNNTLTVLSVCCNFAVVKFHDQLGFVEIGAQATMSVTCMFALGLTYVKLGDINAKSSKLLKAWRGSVKKVDALTPVQKKQAAKSIKSLNPLKIELGSFGYYRKPTSIRIIGKLVFYTTKSLMMTKNLF